MKVYLAGEVGPEIEHLQTAFKHRLVSYYYHHKGDLPSQNVLNAFNTYNLDLFLDSGAFSAFMKKEEIPVERYAAYVHNVQDMFTVCSSLDAIGNAEKSYLIFKELCNAGCRVQPVYHAREDTRWLVKYLDEGHDYLFIGGMVPETTKWLLQWLDEIWSNYLTNSDGTPRVRVHGFGLTDQRLMFRYPWYSVDSSSWKMYGIYGWCVFVHPDTKKLFRISFSEKKEDLIKELDSWHYDRLSEIPQYKELVDGWLEESKVTAQQCRINAEHRYTVNIGTFRRMNNLAPASFKRVQEGIW